MTPLAGWRPDADPTTPGIFTDCQHVVSTLYGYVGAPAPIDGPMSRVRKGETVIRSHAPADEGVFSGLTPSTTAHTVNEVLAPIGGRDGVIGALCLGRSASTEEV